ncbi:hypothetical protein K449DRAFT_388750 [Hypoxylon sp. EC38]|nr:hypothetical protein K449DRAFT_388750 [Hypoxylon sp. EC38]
MSRVVLLACENCRRRKVRCSGTPTRPCDNCVKQNSPCQFDLNRRRRGPRPKRTNTDHEPQASLVPMIEAASPLYEDFQDQIDLIIAPPNPDTTETWRARMVDLFGGENYYLNGFRIPFNPSPAWVLIDET